MTSPSAEARAALMATTEAVETEKPIRSSEKPEVVSPWAVNRGDDPKERVVGWRDGMGLKDTDIRGILRNERQARHEYRAVRKAIAKTKSQEVHDPLMGLPPTWQAFWSTVPHLDPKSAWRAFTKDQQQRQAAAAADAAASGSAADPPGASKDGKAQPSKKKGDGAIGEDEDEEEDEEEEEDDEQLEADVQRLEAEFQKKKELLSEKQKVERAWDEKLKRARYEDKEEEGKLKKVQKRLEEVSYKKGMEQGKLRSSDLYFRYLYLDMQKEHKTKRESLIHSSSIMDMSLSNLKVEVRDLIKATNELQDHGTPSLHDSPVAPT